MTGYELRLWRKGMGWDQERAAEELGKCLRTYKAYEKSAHIDRIAELATRSLTLAALLPALSGKNSTEICRVLGTLIDTQPNVNS
ncbi:MAG TPA: hypothetical protein VGL07_13855 [Buttiauxella sp.]|jgi:transcriptional regulator with XRE-family HTH domain